jgi:hypothetical protein
MGEYGPGDIETILREVRKHGNHGGIQTDPADAWRKIALATLAFNAGMLVWGLATLIELKEDVAVLKCVVNKDYCMVTNGHK